MKKNTYKSILFFVFALCSNLIIAQDAPPSDGVFRLQNVATGKYLTDAGASATAVTMSDNGENPNTHFRFVQSGSFYNIDSETFGILRAKGTGEVVSTSKASPAADTDKTWTLHKTVTENVYRIEARTSSKFLYHEEDGSVTNIVAAETDDRSNWNLVLYVQTPVEVAPDEDTSSSIECSDEFRNPSRTGPDLANKVNVGTIDDRTCYSNYSESSVNGKTWGVYNITDESNHIGTKQPRMERSLSRSSKTGVGSYARFTGTFRILEVGDTGSFNSSGSYLAQAKGKHSGEGGSADPAILLYRAHPVLGTGINAGKQVAFDIYAERILERGGEGSTGREVVFLKRVNKNEEVSFELEVGFRTDPNDDTKKVHYCDAVIGGEAFNYNIPEPERGLESGIRYGAYRVQGGRAQFRWANTTYQKVEKEDIDIAEPSDDIYRLRNLATGKFLTDAGVSATPVTMTDSGEPQNTHWTFVKSGDYFNIDSETFGIMRAKGTGEVVSTNKAAPAADTDKVWTIHDTGTENVFRIEARNNGKFLYHEEDGSVTNKVIADENDQRSIWEAIPTSQSLSIDDSELTISSLKVYPNPANNKFTIALNNIDNASISIYNILGKKVYQKFNVKESLEIMNNNRFETGIYLIRVTDSKQKIYYKKLVIN